MSRTRAMILAALMLLPCFPAFAELPGDELQRAMDQMAADVTVVLSNFGGGVAKDLFSVLARLQVALFAIGFLWKNPGVSIEAFGLAIGKQFVLLGVLWAIIDNWGIFGAMIPHFFIEVGFLVTTIEGYNPTSIATQGFSVVNEITRNPRIGFLSFTTGGLMPALIGIGLIAGYLVMFVLGVRVMANSYFTFTLGPLFMAFGAYKRTASIAESWMQASLSSGIEMLTFYISVGMAQFLVLGWLEDFNQILLIRPDMQLFQLFMLMCGVWFMTIVVGVMPIKMGQIGQGWRPGLSEML